jgi:hypothetical protein
LIATVNLCRLRIDGRSPEQRINDSGHPGPGVGGALVAARKSLARSANRRPPEKQAGDFGGTVAELAEERDDAGIRLTRALDEIPLPQ